jgi:translation initiation factor 3 subunit B
MSEPELKVPDDIDDLEDFMDDGYLSFEVEPMSESLTEAVVVDGMPVVDVTTDKKQKLLNVLTKFFGQVASDSGAKIVSMSMPAGDDNKSLGFAFIEFDKSEAAVAAVKRVNGHRLDKKHVFRVTAYEEFQRISELAAEYTEPPEPPLKPLPDTTSWMTDSLSRDQFALRYSAGGTEETGVFWSEASRNPVLFYGGEREKTNGKMWCERGVKWSPKGAYLATFHEQGVMIWGGDGMQNLGRLKHDCRNQREKQNNENGVNRLSFSPCERFMVTCNERPREQGESTVIVWDLATKKALRQMPLTFTKQGPMPPPGHPDERQLHPNYFRWSPDGNYLAHMAGEEKGGIFENNSLIKVYSLPSMTLLDSKSLRCNGVKDFQWSPTDNVISYWAAESGNQPARVSLIELPSRKEVLQKNLFNVKQCLLTWHEGGDYLAVTVVHHTKSKKTEFMNLNLFRIREAGIPVETLEIGQKQIMFLSWEPNGTRFGMIVAEGAKPSVLFYCMKGPKKERQELTLLKKLEQRDVSHLFWSPNGGYIVLAALQGFNDYSGNFEFYDVDEMPERGTEMEHYRANAVDWDPSGRIVATAVVQPMHGMVYKFQMDNGYHLHTFQGETFYEKNMEKFYAFSWRPRPPSLLDAAAKKSVIKNLRKYERKFERADKLSKEKRNLFKLRDFQKMRDEIRIRISERSEHPSFGEMIQLRTQMRTELTGGYDIHAEENFVVEQITREVVLSEKEETVRMM